MKKKKKLAGSKTKTIQRRIFEPLDFIVIGLCAFCILLSGAGLWYGTLDYTKAEESYQELQKYVMLVDETPSTVVVNSQMKAAVEDQTYYIDWQSLRKVNPDVVAWVKIPGTVVDYPVVQTTSNQTYLKKAFDGSKNACGTIFMNTYNRTDFSDYNTVLYGHNMRNGSMFAVINKYKDESFYQEHKEVWIFTPYWERKYQIVSAHEATDGTETYAVEFGDKYPEHLASEVQQSIYDTGNGYNTELPMVTLSTCTGRGTLSRMVLICQPVYETKLNPFVEDEGNTESETVTEEPETKKK